MNKTTKRLIHILAAIALLISLDLPRVVGASGPGNDAATPKTAAVDGSGLPGNWEGTLNAGALKIRIQVHVEKTADGKLRGTFTSPDQSPKPVPLTACAETATGATFAISAGSYKGTFNADGSRLNGHWKQNGQSLPLNLKRMNKTPAPAKSAPAKPAP